MNKDQILTTTIVIDMIIYMVLGVVAYELPVSGAVCATLLIADLMFAFWLSMVLYKEPDNMEFLGGVGAVTVLAWNKFKLVPRG